MISERSTTIWKFKASPIIAGTGRCWTGDAIGAFVPVRVPSSHTAKGMPTATAATSSQVAGLANHLRLPDYRPHQAPRTCLTRRFQRQPSKARRIRIGERTALQDRRRWCRPHWSSLACASDPSFPSTEPIGESRRPCPQSRREHPISRGRACRPPPRPRCSATDRQPPRARCPAGHVTEPPIVSPSALASG